MLMPSQGVRILVATKAVDFRKGHDGLAALVQGSASEAPIAMPSASRRPSVFTPTAIVTATDTIRPPWRTLR